MMLVKRTKSAALRAALVATASFAPSPSPSNAPKARDGPTLDHDDTGHARSFGDSAFPHATALHLVVPEVSAALGESRKKATVAAVVASRRLRRAAAA